MDLSSLITLATTAISLLKTTSGKIFSKKSTSGILAFPYIQNKQLNVNKKIFNLKNRINVKKKRSGVTKTIYLILTRKKTDITWHCTTPCRSDRPGWGGLAWWRSGSETASRLGRRDPGPISGKRAGYPEWYCQCSWGISQRTTDVCPPTAVEGICWRNSPANKQTNKQTNKPTNKQTNKQIHRQKSKQTSEQTTTNKQSDKRANKRANKQTNKQTNKQQNI